MQISVAEIGITVEIMSNNYKIFPFLTPSNYGPLGISKIPANIPS